MNTVNGKTEMASAGNSFLKKIRSDKKLTMMVLLRAPGRQYTLDEIADYTGLSKERIRQIERDALKKLRKNGRWLWKEIGCLDANKLQMF